MIDFLVVGFGIAGATIAHELEKRNLSFHIVDSSKIQSATLSAGGIINPVTGRKYALQWNIEQLLQQAKTTYKELEEKLQIQTFRNTEIIRLHKSADALQAWKSIKQDLAMNDWLSEFNASDNLGFHFRNNFGGIKIKNALQIFPQQIISAYSKLLLLNNKILQVELQHEDLQLKENKIHWNNMDYRYIIFCEGYAAIKNPLLQFLQFKPAKGQYFILHIPELQTENTFQKEIAVVPLGKELFWAGATNEWDNINNEPTETGFNQLKNKLDELLITPYTIQQHAAGVRPTMKNRTPVIGRHPEHNNVFLLNGLGTKGFSLAPYYAPLLIAHILNDAALPENVIPKK
ncbi:MAG: FAD-binding oxidoreductase [Bacteroidetes bacterium]|nr:FAD-binding oxidoreductase [Bacteroidota bacterium]